MNGRQKEVCQWARNHIDARDFVIVDTETTGLDETAEVVSIAVVNAWGKLAFSSLVKPKVPIDEMGTAFKVNGISNAMVADAPTAVQMIHPFGLHLGLSTIIAYNTEFDRKMVKQSFGSVAPNGWECAMLHYACYHGEQTQYGDFRWQRLENVCLQMDITPRGFHGAASDALLTYDLIKALSDRLD